MFIKLGVVLVLFAVVCWLWVIFDAITADANQVRLLPKWVWVLLTVLPIAGTLAWVLFGRPRDHRSGPSGPGALLLRRQPTRSVGPDDDPDFLRGL